MTRRPFEFNIDLHLDDDAAVLKDPDGAKAELQKLSDELISNAVDAFVASNGTLHTYNLSVRS